MKIMLYQEFCSECWVGLDPWGNSQVGKGRTKPLFQELVCSFLLLKVHGDGWKTECGILVGGGGASFFEKGKKIHQHKFVQWISSRNRDESNKQIPEPWMGQTKERNILKQPQPHPPPWDRRQEGKRDWERGGRCSNSTWFVSKWYNFPSSHICFAHYSSFSVTSLSVPQPLSFSIPFSPSVPLHHLTGASSKVTKYLDLFKMWDFRQWTPGQGTLLD